MKTLLLNKDEVGKFIDLDAVLEAVEKGYKSFKRKSCSAGFHGCSNARQHIKALTLKAVLTWMADILA